MESMTDDRQPNCPRCNQLIPADAKTCPHCGYLIEIEPPVSRAELAAEELDVMSWLSRGWQLFLTNPAGFIGFGFVALAVTVAAVLASEEIPIIGSLLPTAVSAPLFAGFFTASFKLLRDQPLEFGDFLRGFDTFVPLVLGALVSNILVTIGVFLLLLPGIYLIVGYTFMNTLIVDAKMDFWQAMESSRKVVHRQWWTFCRFGALLFLINIVGMLAFGVGALVSLPVTYCAVAVAYADVFGLRNE